MNTDYITLATDLISSEICFKDSEDLTFPIHAPIAISPTPFPRVAFDRAVELQPFYNELVLRTIQNDTLLHQVCSKLSLHDPFVARLYQIYLKFPTPTTLFFNINRSDYMVESDDKIFQIELNTISASLAGLSDKLSLFQRFRYPSLEIPKNEALSKLAKCFEDAVDLYRNEYYNIPETNSTQTQTQAQIGILFIIQGSERNYYDQAHLQKAINPSIPILRKTLLDPSIFSVAPDGLLLVDGIEIAVVYYRAGYSPEEYTSELFWTSRTILESSRAIKCPDIAAHLAGLKKIQQVLASPSNLLQTLNGDEMKASALASTFAGIYSLDEGEESDKNVQMALADPERFVLKPQREGGGNNTYGLAVRDALLTLSPSQRSAHILMDRIRPTHHQTQIIRNQKVSQINAVSELGIYGVILARNNVIMKNEQVGWLLRTKPEESNEGGVVSGYSVLDAPALY